MKHFWVVTNPTRHSELADICFQTTPIGLIHYGIGARSGGADLEELEMQVYATEEEAAGDATERLARRARGEEGRCR